MHFIDASPPSVFKRQVVSSVVTNLSIEPLITNIRLLSVIFNLAVEDVNKKVEGVVRALVAEVLTKFEKKKKNRQRTGVDYPRYVSQHEEARRRERAD
jgi:hypothetical protein